MSHSAASQKIDHTYTENYIANKEINFVFLRNSQYAEAMMTSYFAKDTGHTMISCQGEGRMSYISRRDCIKAAMYALAREDLYYATLNINVPEILTLQDFVAIGDDQTKRFSLRGNGSHTLTLHYNHAGRYAYTLVSLQTKKVYRITVLVKNQQDTLIPEAFVENNNGEKTDKIVYMYNNKKVPTNQTATSNSSESGDATNADQNAGNTKPAQAGGGADSTEMAAPQSSTEDQNVTKENVMNTKNVKTGDATDVFSYVAGIILGLGAMVVLRRKL